MTRSEILDELQQAYASQREENYREEARRQAEACGRIPGLAEALEKRGALIASGLKSALRHSGSLQRLPEQMQAQNREIARLLAQGGFPEDYLAPVYRCARCQDTGYVGDTVRTMCPCMQRELNRRLCRQLGLESREEQSFERFRPEVFPNDRPLQNWPLTQRELMLSVRDQCRDWCDAWPETPVRTLLLSGPSGLGKTFLLHAMAKRLLERGLNVALISAYRFVEAARQAVFERQGDALDSLMGCDVLLMDDLGSEPVIDNITHVHLYNLVNERLNGGKATVLSTNLSVRELKEHYTERIASRLTDKHSGLVLELRGQDIRRL